MAKTCCKKVLRHLHNQVALPHRHLIFAEQGHRFSQTGVYRVSSSIYAEVEVAEV